MSDRRLPGGDLRALLRPALASRSSPQVSAEDLVPSVLAGRPEATVIDLGCGRGDSVDVFRAADPAVRWIGLELPDSETFRGRTRDDADFRVFDGVHLPFADHSVDVVFCKQVLEHVERPHQLLPDVRRVLRSGGVFAGSTSHLEPYHGYSIANFTPYGLKRLLERSGFELELIRPGIDGPTLIARRLLRGAKWFDRWWARRSPLNSMLDGVSRVLRWDAEDRNAIKLQFCGQYAFVARRA
jgi:SAM-dependent methyltransferase